MEERKKGKRWRTGWRYEERREGSKEGWIKRKEGSDQAIRIDMKKEANRQWSKEASKLRSKQAEKQASKQANKKANK